MDEDLRAQRDASLGQLAALIRRGRQLRDDDAPALRRWQQDCAELINQLSGGSKAHWLAHAFSGALLVSSPAGGAVVEASVRAIVARLIGVLEQAEATLSSMDSVAAASDAPHTRRFEFVHNPPLRPILEQAYLASGRAFEDGQFDLAMTTSCGILEAIITDALEHFRSIDPGLEAGGWKLGGDPDAPQGRIADWPFETRIAVAEKAGLIRGGCARLPPGARAYRDLARETVSERDARLARQVLHVVMRDLDPGR